MRKNLVSIYTGPESQRKPTEFIVSVFEVMFQSTLKTSEVLLTCLHQRSSELFQSTPGL
jgi:hypothetical protein